MRFEAKSEGAAAADPVDALLAAHGVAGPWERLLDTGVANRIYATQDVVLRVATDHEDAIVDAYTESVAAPVARRAGVRTPALIAFDDSLRLVDRPYSLWDRVHGETLCLAKLSGEARQEVWREVGQQLAHLHATVRECPDPQGYLDQPGREMDWESTVRECDALRLLSAEERREITGLFAELEPLVAGAEAEDCFLHNDLHDRNLLCGKDGGLLALIDWGDAGWGDPVLDFAAVPLEALRAVLEGYGEKERLGRAVGARLVWDQLLRALERAREEREWEEPLGRLRQFWEEARAWG